MQIEAAPVNEHQNEVATESEAKAEAVTKSSTVTTIKVPPVNILIMMRENVSNIEIPLYLYVISFFLTRNICGLIIY